MCHVQTQAIHWLNLFLVTTRAKKQTVIFREPDFHDWGGTPWWHKNPWNSRDPKVWCHQLCQVWAKELYVLQNPILEERSQLLWISPAISCEPSWFLFGKKRGCFIEILVILAWTCPYLFLNLSIQARCLPFSDLWRFRILRDHHAAVFLGILSHLVDSIGFCRFQLAAKKNRQDPFFGVLFVVGDLFDARLFFEHLFVFFGWVVDPWKLPWWSIRGLVFCDLATYLFCFSARICPNWGWKNDSTF